jgi:hypothetical protein
MSNHVSISGADYGRASSNLDSNHVECSGKGGEEPQADMEGDMKVNFADDEVDPYEKALQMCNLLDGGKDTFFR